MRPAFHTHTMAGSLQPSQSIRHPFPFHPSPPHLKLGGSRSRKLSGLMSAWMMCARCSAAAARSISAVKKAHSTSGMHCCRRWMKALARSCSVPWRDREQKSRLALSNRWKEEAEGKRQRCRRHDGKRGREGGRGKREGSGRGHTVEPVKYHIIVY